MSYYREEHYNPDEARLNEFAGNDPLGLSGYNGPPVAPTATGGGGGVNINPTGGGDNGQPIFDPLTNRYYTIDVLGNRTYLPTPYTPPSANVSVSIPPEDFGAPYFDPNTGQYVQQGSRGTIRVVAQPAKPAADPNAQFVTLPGGGYGSFDPATGQVTVIQPGTAPAAANSPNVQVIGDSTHGYQQYDPVTKTWTPIPGTAPSPTAVSGSSLPSSGTASILAAIRQLSTNNQVQADANAIAQGQLAVSQASQKAQELYQQAQIQVARETLAQNAETARKQEGLAALGQLQSSIGSYDPAEYAAFMAGNGNNLINGLNAGGNALSDRLLNVSALQMDTARNDLGDAAVGGGGGTAATTVAPGGPLAKNGTADNPFAPGAPTITPPPTYGRQPDGSFKVRPYVAHLDTTDPSRAGPPPPDPNRLIPNPFDPTHTSMITVSQAEAQAYAMDNPANVQTGARVDANTMVGGEPGTFVDRKTMQPVTLGAPMANTPVPNTQQTANGNTPSSAPPTPTAPGQDSSVAWVQGPDGKWVLGTTTAPTTAGSVADLHVPTADSPVLAQPGGFKVYTPNGNGGFSQSVPAMATGGTVNAPVVMTGDSPAPNPFSGGAKPEMILNPTRAPLGVLNSRTVANLTQNGHLTPTGNPFATPPRFAMGTADQYALAPQTTTGPASSTGALSRALAGGSPILKPDLYVQTDQPGDSAIAARIGTRGTTPGAPALPFIGQPQGSAPIPNNRTMYGRPLGGPPQTAPRRWQGPDMPGWQGHIHTIGDLPSGYAQQPGGVLSPRPPAATAINNPFMQPLRLAWGTFNSFGQPAAPPRVAAAPAPRAPTGADIAVGNYGAQASPGSVQQIRDIRTGISYPNLNMNDVNFNQYDPSVQQSYFQGLQTAKGIPIAASQWWQQHNALAGFQQGQDQWGY